MNNTLSIVLAVVIIVGGGWWYVASLEGEKGGSAAGTMLEGGEMVDNGMVGGDAAMPLPGKDAMEKIAIKEFTVTGSSFAFAPGTMTVKKGETVRIVFTNSGGMHDWVLDEFAGARTKILKAGETETIEFVADKVGTFEYYCSVGQHRAAGMKGAFTVTEN
jgi:nitrite reductase (NO-forming)